MIDPDYTLAWPRELFVWEAKRILDLPRDTDWEGKVRLLCSEAFEDAGVAEYIDLAFTPVPRPWGVAGELPPAPVLSDWFEALVADESKLRPRRQRVYWAERNGTLDEEDNSRFRTTFSQDWAGLVSEFEAAGYFPRLLPKQCDDDESNWFTDEQVSSTIRKATKLSVAWPITPDSLSMPIVFSLIEYFHDQAQRPRVATPHRFNDCGDHYSHFNTESGGVIYRWKVNALLETHGVPFRIASQREERGHLVSYFGGEVDAVLTEEVDSRRSDAQDEVAHAIRMFRDRSANRTEKRAALNLLARELEQRKGSIAKLVTKGDESDIFQIANMFDIRHRNDKQKTEYGDEFLEWIFLNYLAMIRLMDALHKREPISPGRPVSTSGIRVV